MANKMTRLPRILGGVERATPLGHGGWSMRGPQGKVIGRQTVRASCALIAVCYGGTAVPAARSPASGASIGPGVAEAVRAEAPQPALQTLSAGSGAAVKAPIKIGRRGNHVILTLSPALRQAIQLHFPGYR